MPEKLLVNITSHCVDSTIYAIITNPTSLIGRHCIGWCTDIDSSTIDSVNTNITDAQWTALVNDNLHNHNFTLLGIPDWTSKSYPEHSIVWYSGSYWYAATATSSKPGDGTPGNPWSILPSNSSEWSYVINDSLSGYSTTYDTLYVSYDSVACPVMNCNTVQVQLGTPFGTGTNKFYYVHATYANTYIASGLLYDPMEFIPPVINLDNCYGYVLSYFEVPNWVDGSYLVNDYVCYNDNFYTCIRATSGNPDSDPTAWTLIGVGSADYSNYWHDAVTANATPYANGINVKTQQLYANCTSTRIDFSYELLLDCNSRFLHNVMPDSSPRHVYTFIDVDNNISVPETNAVNTGLFSQSHVSCGVDYIITSYSIPQWVNDAGVIYFKNSYVWYDNKIYLALQDISGDIDILSAPFVHVSDDNYTAGLLNQLVSIEDTCYMGTANFVKNTVSCTCVPKYDVGFTAISSGITHKTTFGVTASIDNGLSESWHSAIFLFAHGNFYMSLDTADTVTLALPNNNYTANVYVAPEWSSLNPYLANSVVWYNDSFYVTTVDTSSVPSQLGSDWVELGLSESEYNSTWVNSRYAPNPVNGETFNFVVDLINKKDPVIQLLASHSYMCQNDELDCAYNVITPDNINYCIVEVAELAEVANTYTIPPSGSPIHGPVRAQLNMHSSPVLNDGMYPIETYAIPCWVDDEVYNTGEIVYNVDSIYICNTDGTVSEPIYYSTDWTLVTDNLIHDVVSTIKNPSYAGRANYVFGTFNKECVYDKWLVYNSTAYPVCEDLSIDVSYNSSVTNVKFAFISWLFDVSGIDKPLTSIVCTDLIGYTSMSENITSDAFTITGLENDKSYGVLSIAIPYYKPNVAYHPGDIVFYNGSMWQVDQNGTSTMSSPSTVGSPPEWILLDSVWSNWNSYVEQGSTYNSYIAIASFDCITRKKADMLDFTHSDINSNDASFGLFKTNPALTGNIVMTIDTVGDLWMNSINANPEISRDQYKHYPVDTTKSHPANVYRFFDNGKTPNNTIFDIHADVNPTVLSSKYEDQFDFSFYYSGVKYMDSKYYDEKFTYFAPLYIKKVIPEYFVIFKINDPLNMPIDQLKSYDYNQADYMYELMKRATLIKSFDMSENTKLGKYIRSILNDEMFPESPLSVDFNAENLTTWNGVSVKSGTWNSIGERLSSLFENDDALKYFEDYVTLGYSRNGIIFPNILNLEFLFDDNTSEIFDFNRYIGFYVNAVQLEQFDIDVNKYNMQQSKYGNAPVFFDIVDSTSDNERNITNPNGVVIPYLNRENDLDYRDFGLLKSKLFVNYVKDKNNVLHSLNTQSPYDIIMDNSGNPTHQMESMRLADTAIDLSDFFGTDELFIQDYGQVTSKNGLATACIQILGDLNNYDVIRIYHDAGSNTDDKGKYDDINVYSQASSPEYLPVPGDYYYYAQTGSPYAANSYYINGKTLHGSVDTIVSAISGCLNEFPNKTFEVITINDCIFLRSYSSSIANGEYGIEFISVVSDKYDNIKVNDYTGITLVDNVIAFEGGTDFSNRLVLDSKHKQKILDSIDNLLVRTVNGWSKIISVANYMDALDLYDLTTSTGKAAAYSEYFNTIVICLDKNEQPDISDSTFLIKTAAHAEFGLLSFFNVKDFDGDFYSSKYNKYPYWEYYKHLVIPSNKNLLQPGVRYIARANNIASSISYNGNIIELSSTNQFTAAFDAVPDVLSYTVVSGAPNVTYAYPYKYSDTDNSTVLEALCQPSTSPVKFGSIFFDDNKDMNSFDGFFAIRDSRARSVNPSAATYGLNDYNNKFTNDIIRSEYDYYRENYTKDFAFKSKLMPYICKWGYLDGKDARDNEYRLNNHIFFGENNFSPSHIHENQNESHMTHEWYYLVSKYSFINDSDTIADNYCYFDTDINMTELLNTDGEFERYFTYVPTQEVDGVVYELGNIQKRYSIIKYNAAVNKCETFFRGAKVVFNNSMRDNYGNIVYDNITKKPVIGDARRFEGYKFSVLLRPVKEDLNNPDQPPIRMRFIEQPEFKFVLFIIEVAIGYSDNIGLTQYSPIKRSDIDQLYLNSANNRVDGDYRVIFHGDTSDISYSFLYGIKNKKFWWYTDCFSTIRIATRFSDNDFTIDRAYNELHSAYSNYDENLLSEITEFGGNDKNKTAPYIVAAEFYDRTVFNGYPVYVTQNSMTTAAGMDFSYYVAGGAFSPHMSELSAFKQIAGGRKYYEKFIKKLSFASICNYINEMGPYKDKLDSFVEYETYTTDSSAPVTRDFYAEILPPAEVIKTSAIVPTAESVIPDKFTNVPNIGFQFNRGALQNGYILYRHAGTYEPIFRPIFSFASQYDFTYNSNLKSIFRGNNIFATSDKGFGVLDNFNHLKIANKKILALHNDSKFYPAYELINEITIGRDKFLALHSSWDYGFHKKYIAKDKFEPVAGSLRVAEDYTYMSKVLNLPFETTLLDYSIHHSQIPYDSKITYAPTRVKSLSSVDMEKYCFVYTQGKDKNEWVGYINLRNAMIHKFKMNGVSNKFNEFLLPSNTADIFEYTGFTDIDDYVTAYLNDNVYPLYDVADVYFYMRSYNSVAANFGVIYNDDSILINENWSVLKDTEINKYSKYLLSFRFVKPLNSGAILSPVIKIKLI